MKTSLPIERRPVLVPKHRVELRGPRRSRPRRHGIRTRCGYLLSTAFV